MKIIPAIDLIGGQCVRLTKGNFDTKKVYSTNPIEVAERFYEMGFKNLHLVDLDGAKSGKPINLSVLEKIALKTKLAIDYGGGLRDSASVKSAFDAGAAAVTAGSIAITNHVEVNRWIATWGASRIIIGADSLNGKIAVNGWQQTKDIGLFEFISEYLSHGARRFICTDVSKDGMLLGSSVELYKELIARFPNIELVASGGVSSIKELVNLKQLGLWGAIVGKAIYEGVIDIDELAEEVKNAD